MKRLLLMGLLVTQGYAMNNNNAPMPTGSTEQNAVNDIITQLENALQNYNATSDADKTAFKALVQSYFNHESIVIEQSVIPHLTDLIAKNDSAIATMVAKQDKEGVESYMDTLMTQALENAFQSQQDNYAQLQTDAQNSLKKARIALATAIVTGVLGIVGTFLGIYFGVK